MRDGLIDPVSSMSGVVMFLKNRLSGGGIALPKVAHGDKASGHEAPLYSDRVTVYAPVFPAENFILTSGLYARCFPPAKSLRAPITGLEIRHAGEQDG